MIRTGRYLFIGSNSHEDVDLFLISRKWRDIIR